MDNQALSPIENLMPRTYIRQIYCFPSQNASVPGLVKRGLARTVDDIPSLAGGVTYQDHSQGKLALTPVWQSIDDIFTFQNLSETLNYSSLRTNNFSPVDLAISELIHPDTKPPFDDPAPVLRVVLVLVQGGYLLCVAIHHCTTDITGFGILLKIWASHCRTGPNGNPGSRPWLDRTSLVRCRATICSDLVPDLLHLPNPLQAPQPSRGSSSVEFQTAIVHFPHHQLLQLKCAVNEYLSSIGLGWASTSDTLIAVLWSSVLVAENNAGLLTDRETSTIGIPVNIRNKLLPPIPEDYIGAAFAMTSASASRSTLLDASTSASIQQLASVAAEVRKSIDLVNHANTSKMLSYLASRENLTGIKLGPPHDGISIVSWADQGVYELDWGVELGRCEAVRLPRVDGRRYPIILPRLRVDKTEKDGGGIEVFLSLEKGVMSLFKNSNLIKKHAVIRC